MYHSHVNAVLLSRIVRANIAANLNRHVPNIYHTLGQIQSLRVQLGIDPHFYQYCQRINAEEHSSRSQVKIAVDLVVYQLG